MPRAGHGDDAVGGFPRKTAPGAYDGMQSDSRIDSQLAKSREQLVLWLEQVDASWDAFLQQRREDARILLDQLSMLAADVGWFGHEPRRQSANRSRRPRRATVRSAEKNDSFDRIDRLKKEGIAQIVQCRRVAFDLGKWAARDFIP